MDSEKIKAIFQTEGITSEIPCQKAFELSDKYSISKMDIAQYCNTHSIKIRACQLGCFK
jgi:hypothetical protein